MSTAPASPGTVTRCLSAARQSDDDAARALWMAYGGSMEGLARAVLRRAALGAYREHAEDAAQSAFATFFRRLARGDFSRLGGRGELARLLGQIVVRKARDRIASERTLKRGGGRARRDLDLDALCGPSAAAAGIEQLEEACRDLLDGLGDDTLRLIALWRVEEYTDTEIAERLGCSRASVQRKLQWIRRLWTDEFVRTSTRDASA